MFNFALCCFAIVVLQSLVQDARETNTTTGSVKNTVEQTHTDVQKIKELLESSKYRIPFTQFKGHWDILKCG